jgi:hypothetical protein
LPLGQGIVTTPSAAALGADQSMTLIRDQIDQQMSVLFSDSFYTMPLESQGFSNYAFYEHESYPPSYRFGHQQEVPDLIHAFKFLDPLAPTNSCEEPVL